MAELEASRQAEKQDESKRTASDALSAAMGRRDVDTLRYAIARGRQAGLSAADIAAAEALEAEVLAEAEREREAVARRAKAEAELAEATAAGGPAARLEDAIATGRSLGLDVTAAAAVLEKLAAAAAEERR